MRYYIILLLTLGFSYNVMGASSSSRPSGFELEDPVTSKSYIPMSCPDLRLLAHNVSKTIDPKKTFMAAAQQMLAVERSTPEGYRRWIHATASTTPPTPTFPDDGLGIDDFGRPILTAADEAYKHRILYEAWKKAEAVKIEEVARKAEAYRRKIIYAAWQAAEARKKEEADAAFYRHAMITAGLKALGQLQTSYQPRK